MNMKTLILLATLWCGAVVGAAATLYSFTWSSGFENNGLIPDGNVNPWSDTRTISGIVEPNIVSVSLRLSITGGYNGDLYGYLSFNDAKLVLLNRVGVGTGTEPTYSFGYAGAGFTNLVLQDGADDIHTYGGGVGSGTFSADGRDVSPLASPAVLYATSRDTFFSTFGGMNPNGDWTLVFADIAPGGGQSQITSWGLEIVAVPEPGTGVLGLLAGVQGLVSAVYLIRRRKGN